MNFSFRLRKVCLRDSSLILNLIFGNIWFKVLRYKFIAAVNIVMVYKICVRYHRCCGKSPPEAPGYNIYKSFTVKLIHFLRLFRIIDLGKQRLILTKGLFDQSPFFFVVSFVGLYRCFQDCILKLCKFVIRPIHRKICFTDHLKVRIEKRGFAF